MAMIDPTQQADVSCSLLEFDFSGIEAVLTNKLRGIE